VCHISSIKAQVQVRGAVQFQARPKEKGIDKLSPWGECRCHDISNCALNKYLRQFCAQTTKIKDTGGATQEIKDL